MSATQTFKIILDRNEVDAYFKSSEARGDTLNEPKFGIQKRKRFEPVDSEPLAMRTRSRTVTKHTLNETASTRSKSMPEIEKQTLNIKPQKRTRSQTTRTNENEIPPSKRKESSAQIEGWKPVPEIEKQMVNIKPQKRMRSQTNVNEISKKRRVKQIIKTNALMPSLHLHQLIWAYIRGFPFWPGVIEKLLPNGKYRIHFFGDYSHADVTRRCILNFFEGFSQFECNFGNIKL